MRVILDIECFPNYIILVFYNLDDQKIYTFEISDWENQIKELKEFCKKVSWYIGYNIKGYDGPMLQYILSGKNNIQCYDYSNKITSISVSPYVHIKYIDLMLLNHYDIKSAKATNLKKLAFNYRMNNVADLPYSYKKPLLKNQKSSVKSYCIDDVMDTVKCYEISKEKLIIRKELGSLFGVNILNSSDPNMAETIFAKLLQINPFQLVKVNYEHIAVKDLIFNYIGNGFLTDKAKAFFQNIDLKSGANKYKIKDDSLNYVFETDKYSIKWALGGVHGNANKGLYRSDDEYIIKTADVASLYPSTILNNKLYPHQLGSNFLNIYQWFKDKRFTYAKGTPLNLGFKLLINLVYGKLNSEYSIFYDPKMLFTVTINNQLCITELCDNLFTIPECELIEINTDGITVKIPRKYEDEYNIICKNWENRTMFVLEYDNYSQVFLRDVNNYHAITTSGKFKRKGVFATYEDVCKEEAYHKDTSSNIIPLALHEYLTNNIIIEDYIRNHNNIFDFLIGEGSKSSPKKGKPIFQFTGRNEYGVATVEREDSRYLRYFASNSDTTLSKIYPGKIENNKVEVSDIINVHSNTNITLCKKLKKNWKIEDFDINYQWYINQINDILL